MTEYFRCAENGLGNSAVVDSIDARKRRFSLPVLGPHDLN